MKRNNMLYFVTWANYHYLILSSTSDWKDVFFLGLCLSKIHLFQSSLNDKIKFFVFPRSRNIIFILTPHILNRSSVKVFCGIAMGQVNSCYQHRSLSGLTNQNIANSCLGPWHKIVVCVKDTNETL